MCDFTFARNLSVNAKLEFYYLQTAKPEFYLILFLRILTKYLIFELKRN